LRRKGSRKAPFYQPLSSLPSVGLPSLALFCQPYLASSAILNLQNAMAMISKLQLFTTHQSILRKPSRHFDMASFMFRTAPRAIQQLRPAQISKRPAAPLFRRFLTTQAEQPRLRLGSTGRVTPNPSKRSESTEDLI
jgi:hypothetical protein